MFTMIIAVFVVHGADPFAKKELGVDVFDRLYMSVCCWSRSIFCRSENSRKVALSLKSDGIRLYLLGSFVVGALAYGGFHLGKEQLGSIGEVSEQKIDKHAKRAASRQLVKQEPEALSIDKQLALAVEMVDSGDVERASELLEGILLAEPNNIKALLEMSLIELLDRGRPQKALPYLVNALQVDPNNDHLLGKLPISMLKRVSSMKG